MDISRIRVPFRARPFRPFEIVTASGESYRVAGPEAMAIDPEGLVVIVMGPDGSVGFIDVASVTEVVIPRSAPASRADRQD